MPEFGIVSDPYDDNEHVELAEAVQRLKLEIELADKPRRRKLYCRKMSLSRPQLAAYAGALHELRPLIRAKDKSTLVRKKTHQLVVANTTRIRKLRRYYHRLGQDRPLVFCIPRGFNFSNSPTSMVYRCTRWHCPFCWVDRCALGFLKLWEQSGISEDLSFGEARADNGSCPKAVARMLLRWVKPIRYRLIKAKAAQLLISVYPGDLGTFSGRLRWVSYPELRVSNYPFDARLVRSSDISPNFHHACGVWFSYPGSLFSCEPELVERIGQVRHGQIWLRRYGLFNSSDEPEIT